MLTQQHIIKRKNKRVYLLLVLLCVMLCGNTKAQESDTIKIQNTSNGIIRPDYTFNFTIPENPVFVYDTTGYLIVYDYSTQPPTEVGRQKLNDDGKPVFPMTVKDKDGNVYKLTEETDENGNKTIKFEYLGKQGTPLTADNFDANNIDSDKAIVNFEKGAGKYAFDKFDIKFSNSVRIRDKYTKIGDYNVPWKFLPEGGSDKIQAKIIVVDNSIDLASVMFQTPQGMLYEKKHLEGATFEITAVAGADNDVQQIYALYPTGGGKFLNLGRIDVVTYKPQTAKIVVVSVNGNTVNTGELKAKLNGIYNEVGVTVEVETDAFTYNNTINFFEETSGWFSRYTSAMKAFNIAYRENIGERYDKDKNYLFILDKDSSRNDRDAQGFMPLGGRFGYLFKNQIPTDQINTIAAHELGHGIWALKHTFDNDYGNIAVNTTENLMDYTPHADHLAKWQWEIIRYPALFTDPFGSDDEGMWLFNPGQITNMPLDSKYAYLLPTGKPVIIDNIKSGAFNVHGHLARFILTDNDEYLAVYSTNENNVDRFYGYIKSTESGNIKTKTIEQIEAIRFRSYKTANNNDTIFAYSKNFAEDKNRKIIFLECFCKHKWLNNFDFKDDTGIAKYVIVPPNSSQFDCSGNECDIENSDVKPGFGYSLYKVLYPALKQGNNNNVTEQQIDDLVALANMLTDAINEEGKKEASTGGYYFTYAFYADALEVANSDNDYIEYFKNNKIYNIDKFNEIFKYKLNSRDYSLIYSTIDLWDGIDNEFRELYNGASVDWTSFSVPQINTEEELFDALDRLEYVVTTVRETDPSVISEDSYDKILQYIYDCTDNSELALSQKFHLNQTIRNIYAHLGAYEHYDYSYADLRVRYSIKKSNSVLWTVINNLEQRGYASAISQSDEYRQYINYYGTESAYFLGQYYEGMIGIVYSLHGIQQSTANIGDAIRSIRQQRYNLKIATNRYNLFTSTNKRVTWESSIYGKGEAYRYITDNELSAIQETNLLRGGRSGETYFTKDVY
ncbi:MAG: hypothetical protein LBC68_13265, partial [Prevotellaceae bacterium]|nr:hypothetical protein [Prevotellaceae bacterium]